MTSLSMMRKPQFAYVTALLVSSVIVTISCGGSGSADLEAENNNDLPVVSVSAFDASAGEWQPTNTGTYRITRTGSSRLTVYFTMNGSATNGTDYNLSSSSPVTIAAGSPYRDITLTPADDSEVEGVETATLNISSNSNYSLGSSASATINISDNDSGNNNGGLLQVTVLSSRPDLVTGGDALIKINTPPDLDLAGISVYLNGTDVTPSFGPTAGGMMGLVSGIYSGDNTLTVSHPGMDDDSLKVTNYPITGPMISGPHEFPFVCTTADFTPFPGSPTLGEPLDEDCSVQTRVQYVYRTNGGAFAALPEPYSSLPGDLAMTTTLTGATVPYIIRLETGTINRAIYQTAILHNPNDPAPSPFTPPAGWNGRLIYLLGGGCQGGWYTQGESIDSPISDFYLSQGYGVASATLTTFGNNCNDLLSSETVLMVKERFIESYGVPKFTIGTGGSGGSYQCYQTADNYPGTFDGIVTTLSFPDVTSVMVLLGDSRLLDIYFNDTRPGWYTENQQKAISGYLEVNNIAFLSGRTNTGGPARRMDPREVFPAQILSGVGPEYRYDPVTNPYGARGSVYDHTVNVYGQIPDKPFPDDALFAQRPLDNVGVQYGLKALNDGVIDISEFLDLNAMIGGFDIDFNHISSRTVGYPDATRRAYQGGRILGAGNGLANVPIISGMGYGDTVVNGDIHLRFWVHSIRERLIMENGHANNQVIVGEEAPEELLIEQMDRWLTAIASDNSDLPMSLKVVNDKPADVVDACWSVGEKIIEPQTLSGDGQCNALFPAGLSPALVAGAPLTQDVIMCELKPIDMSDYAVSFTEEQQQQLHSIFPDGVCDWSKPDIEQVRSVPWASFGPSPVNLLFDVLNP
jgi:hypothetical protein